MLVLLAATLGLAGAPPESTRQNDLVIDYLYPGQAPHWLGALGAAPAWVDVPIPANAVVVPRMRLLTGSHGWTFSICPSRTLDPKCSSPIQAAGSSAWEGDFTLPEELDYEDATGGKALHLRVESLDGDWMTLRVIMTVGKPDR